MKPRDVHEAVDQLIDRQRVQITRDGGAREWATVPSLFEQLQRSTTYVGTGSGTGGGFGSQPTISMSVVELLMEIGGTVNEAIVNNELKPAGNVPDNLRRVAANLPDDDEREWWAETIGKWAARARVALRLDPQRLREARDTPCPETTCGADTVTVAVDGENVRKPALSITWGVIGQAEHAYHSDKDWLVLGVECRACKKVWLRGDPLDALIDQILRYNLTRETMCDTP